MIRIQKKENLYDSIRGLIANAKAQIVHNINTTIIFTYYEIGRVIVQDEQNGKYRADYAKKVLIKLSGQLSKEFGKGYSPTNLEYIRKFYKVYKDRIPQSVVGKSENPEAGAKTVIPQSVIAEFKSPFVLSWSHYIHLLKIEDDDERAFYEIEASQGNWSPITAA